MRHTEDKQSSLLSNTTFKKQSIIMSVLNAISRQIFTLIFFKGPNELSIKFSLKNFEFWLIIYWYRYQSIHLTY